MAKTRKQHGGKKGRKGSRGRSHSRNRGRSSTRSPSRSPSRSNSNIRYECASLQNAVNAPEHYTSNVKKQKEIVERAYKRMFKLGC
jgi:hypothetical protein